MPRPTRITKGWYVAVHTVDAEGYRHRRTSRVYHSLDAANAYAEICRRDIPGAKVEVRTRTGQDDLPAAL